MSAEIGSGNSGWHGRSGCVRVPATDPHIVEMDQRLIVPTQIAPRSPTLIAW